MTKLRKGQILGIRVAFSLEVHYSLTSCDIQCSDRQVSWRSNTVSPHGKPSFLTNIFHRVKMDSLWVVGPLSGTIAHH
jgi:hypothetical protein